LPDKIILTFQEQTAERASTFPSKT